MDLAIITPSRGRPTNLARLVDALDATCTIGWELWVGLDMDDPELDGYVALPAHERVNMHVDGRGHLCGKTNQLAQRAIAAGAQFLASLGDDHLPRTHGWDKQLCDAITAMPGPGWAYGDDLLRGQALPTAWVQSAQLVGALGWMMLPTCQHLYVDNAVLDLGTAAGRITYLPDVVIEHLHPAAGKAGDDLTYAAGNSRHRAFEDHRAYQRWCYTQLPADTATVKALTWG